MFRHCDSTAETLVHSNSFTEWKLIKAAKPSNFMTIIKQDLINVLGALDHEFNLTVHTLTMYRCKTKAG